MTREELLAAPEADYMNEAQIQFFKQLLEAELADSRARVDSGIENLRSLQKATDEADIASMEEERQTLLRMMDRDRRVIPKIAQALDRIREGTFGWCEETGEPIGLNRLLARPVTNLCVEAKSRQETLEKHQAA